MEKYFLYDVGGVSRDNNASDEFYTDSAESPLEEEDEDEYSDEEFDEKSLQQQQQQNPEEPESILDEVVEEEEPKSIDCPMSDARNTDDSGSVGSESDGRKTPDHKKKKFVRTKNVHRGGERSSDRGESDAHGSEDNTAPYSSDEDGSENDTLKRKKNKGRRGSEPFNLDKMPKLQSANDISTKAESESPKFSPPITPLPSQIIEVQPAATSNENISSSKSISPSLSEKDGFKSSMSPAAPVRKHKSRDSGFVGSMDDLLRNESGNGNHGMGAGNGHTSSDSPQSLSDGENKSSLGPSTSAVIQTNSLRLEKVSEVSGEDDNAMQDDVDKSGLQVTERRENMKVLRTSSSESSTKLSRKDSFNNWSSDEDTNIMMNRMRAFFRNLVTQATTVDQKSGEAPAGPPPQLVAFEEHLTRLMRTVPGINEEQVKEIVEYLSSEDTWSDSYDSSDYTSSDLDLEGIRFEPSDPELPEISSAKLSARSTQNSTPDVPAESDDFQKETALMYQKLMAKMQQNQIEKEKERQATRRSPTVAAKVMHHISSRLVALMHEVTAGSSQESSSEQQQQFEDDVGFSGRRQVGPPTRRFRPPSSASVKSDASGNGQDETSSPQDTESPDNRRKLSKSTSKSVEVLDLSHRRMSLDDKAVGMAKSTSSDYDVWQGVHRNSAGAINPVSGPSGAVPGQRRGSLGLGHAIHSGSSSGMSDLLNDDERWSWKGSFESALAVGETRTSNGHSGKRKSVTSSDNNVPEIFSSVEQISLKQPQQQQQQFGGRGSPTASQGSRRSNRSSVTGSVRSNKVTKSAKSSSNNRKDSESEEESTQIYPPTAQSARFGRRSSIPEEVKVVVSPTTTAAAAATTTSVTVTPPVRHSTNSLPRLGTSSIQQKNARKLSAQQQQQQQHESEVNSEAVKGPSNIVTSSSMAGASVRSARYRPPGYKPPPIRKVSPSAPQSRKSSTDSLLRYTGRSIHFSKC